LESLAQLFDAAKKKLDAEEVSKREELTRIKIELQLALLKAAHLQDELEKEKKNAQNVVEGCEIKMKDMQTQTENTNYEVQGPQGEDKAQKKMNDEPPSAGRDQEIGKRKCAENVDEVRKKRKREVMVDVESSTREDSNQHISIKSNESVEGPLMIDLLDEEIKIVAEVNNSNPGDVQNKAKPMEDQPKPKASKEERVNAEDSLVRDNASTGTTTASQSGRYIDEYGMSWQLVQTDHFLKMVLCPLCPVRPSGKFRGTQLKLANLKGHLRKVHALNCQNFLILRCPDCEENVSAPSLHLHLIEHKTHNINCQPVAGKAPRPARNVWVKKDIFVPGVLADKSI